MVKLSEKYSKDEFSWMNNGIIWLTLDDNMKNLIESNNYDICKLLYLSSLMSNNGKIVKRTRSNVAAKKCDLEVILGIKNYARKNFVRTMVRLGCIDQNDDGLYVNEYLFRKGNLPSNFVEEVRSSGGTIFRAYSTSVCELYWKKTSRGDSIAFRYLMRTLPFIHHEYNILCFNPDEQELEKIIPMKASDFCDQAGYNRTDVTRIFRLMENTTVNDKQCPEYAIIRCKPKEFGIKKSCIFVNPRIFFAGNYDSLLIIQQIFAKYGGILSDTEKAE